MRSFLVVLSLLVAPVVRGQTVVEMDLKSAKQVLSNHKMGAACEILTSLANNYKQYTNIRVQSHRQRNELALLAEAMRTDFDGSGTSYIPELTVWAIMNDTGGRTYLVASLIDRRAVLMTNDLDYLKGMMAYEIMSRLRRGEISLDQARRKAMFLGIEMQVDEKESGKRTISFFGHGTDEDQLVGKLVVIEPPDFTWP